MAAGTEANNRVRRALDLGMTAPAQEVALSLKQVFVFGYMRHVALGAAALLNRIVNGFFEKVRSFVALETQVGHCQVKQFGAV